QDVRPDRPELAVDPRDHAVRRTLPDLDRAHLGVHPGVGGGVHHGLPHPVHGGGDQGALLDDQHRSSSFTAPGSTVTLTPPPRPPRPRLGPAAASSTAPRCTTRRRRSPHASRFRAVWRPAPAHARQGRARLPSPSPRLPGAGRGPRRLCRARWFPPPARGPPPFRRTRTGPPHGAPPPADRPGRPLAARAQPAAGGTGTGGRAWRGRTRLEGR